MKKYIVIAVLLSGMIFAQNNKPKLEAVGDLVKELPFMIMVRYNKWVL
jgi:hypothetical protein